MMKKLTFSLCVMLMSLCFVGCADPSLSDYVEAMQENVPMDSGKGCVVTGVSLANACLQLDMNYDESELRLDDAESLEALQMVAEELKDGYLGNAEMKDLFVACAKENYGFRIVITGAQSGKSATMVEVPSEELKAKFPPAE